MKTFVVLHGCDISGEMIEQARREAPGARYHLLEKAELPVDRLDVVYSYRVFHHVPRSVFHQYVGAVARSLAPGGLFLFQLTRPYTLRRKLKALMGSEPGEDEPWASRYYTRRELRRVAKDHGFSVRYDGDDGLDMILVWAK